MRIGHLTDLHLDRSQERAARFARGVAESVAWGCDHLCVTGDLTARGDDESFDQLGRVLHASGVQPWRVTVVPGNHDVRPDRRPWAATLQRIPSLQALSSWSTPNQAQQLPAHLGGCVVLPLDTTRTRQPLAFRARGKLGPDGLWALRGAGGHAARLGLPLVACMHHGPYESPLHALDGLQDKSAVLEVLRRQATTTTVLCGHDHRSLDLWPRDADGGCARIFVAPAVVDTDDPLRVYEVRGDRLVPVKQAGAGSYLRLEA